MYNSHAAVHYFLVDHPKLSSVTHRFSGWARLHRDLGVGVPPLEVIADLGHSDPLDVLVLIDVLDQALVRQQDVWSGTDIRMHHDREDGAFVLVLAVEVVEVGASRPRCRAG